MRTISLFIMSLVLASLASAQSPLTNVTVAAPNPVTPVLPDIAKGSVCFMEYRENVYGIYRVDVATRTEIRELTVNYAEAQVRQSGDRIVFIEYRGLQPDVAVYNVSTRTIQRLTNDADFQNVPVIDGDVVAWQNYTGTTADISVRRLSTGTTIRVTNDAAYQSDPAVDGSRIVWQDYRNAGSNPNNADIYMYDLQTGTEVAVTTNAAYQAFPDIDGDLVVWEDGRNDGGDIYMLDLSTGEERPICTATGFQTKPVIDGTWIFWQDYRNDANNADIYAFDLVTGTEHALVTHAAHQGEPRYDGERLVWQDLRDGKFAIWSGILEQTKPPVPPGPVQRVAPDSAAANLSQPITLLWEALSDTAKYSVHVSLNADLSAPLVDTSDVTNTSLLLSAFAPGQTVYWRIRASYGTLHGPWSTIWSFTVNDPRTLNIEARSPEGGSEHADTIITLTWSTPTLPPDVYRVEVDTSMSFERVVLDTTISDTTITIDKLDRGTTYWWRVQASGGRAWGPSTEPRSFRIKPRVVNSVGVHPASDQGIRIWYESLTATVYVNVDVAATAQHPVSVLVLDLLGRSTTSNPTMITHPGHHQISAFQEPWSRGMLLVTCSWSSKTWSSMIFIEP